MKLLRPSPVARTILIWFAGAVAGNADQNRAAPAKPVLDLLCSVGDNDSVASSLPFDSKAAIEDSLDMLVKVYHPRRLYFRDLETETFILNSYHRHENAAVEGFYEWERHLIEDERRPRSEPILRMRVLAQVAAGTLQAPVEQITPSLRSPNVIMRRLALSALGATKDPAAVPLLEDALGDPEPSVRGVAAASLGHVSGPASAARLFDAIRRFPNYALNDAVASVLALMDPFPMRVILQAAASGNTDARRAAICALSFVASGSNWSYYELNCPDSIPSGVPAGKTHVDSESEPVIIRALQDSDRLVRNAAAQALAHATDDRPVVVEALLTTVRDGEVSTACRAARSVSILLAQNKPALSSLEPRAVETLRALFQKVSTEETQPGGDWAFRAAGNALRDLGPEGVQALEACKAQRSNHRLAELAWRVLDLPVRADQFSVVCEKEDAAAFAKRPYR